MIRDLVVELVSPVMVGGAANVCDEPPTLRPPSVRGQLRFWARAIGGEALEHRLWGSIDGGQRVRLLGAQILESPRPAFLFPHKHGAKRSQCLMVPPGGRALLRFAIPDPELHLPLQANVWLWLHLGAIGRRSRRGYGSLLVEPHADHLLDGFLDKPFDRWSDLESPERLEAYLRRGLARVFQAFGVEAKEERSSRRGSNPLDYAFDSLDQVFVGREILDGRDFHWHVAHTSSGAPGPDSVAGSLESLLHGLDPAARGASPGDQQLGKGSSKPPSPMMWRLFPMPTSEEGHVVVMTWSPMSYSGVPRLVAASGLAGYLSKNLKLGPSLTGQPLIEEKA